MRLATIQDKEKVIDIISAAFDDNPRVNWVVKQDHKRLQRIRELIRYAFETAFPRNGVMISSNEKAVAVCYRMNLKSNSIYDYYIKLRLGFKGMSPERIFWVMKRQSAISAQRPRDGNYFYFWFLAVEKEERGGRAGWELSHHIFDLARKDDIPIYAETSDERTCRIYQRVGFSLYNSFEKYGIKINQLIWKP
ncbi:GNAT family N-acetyltransferase [Flavihumibacter fluvii]|uniref:GNAT family N-acetyltransferase n=1 Tax=Flavihumibacter fluvii TaxID=2838157 RepID=UPI001BDED8F2|nr:GNAT family N-acetyltransferase [Flavihumibacter fluvii]ULQ50960.1 GNAT family N-acetyltransferase [Flavihumibacter fluvii]